MKVSIRSGKEIQEDVIEWDIRNWTRSVEFWEREMPVKAGGQGLELGSRRGGLSLYFTLNGYRMITSDITDPDDTARPLFRKYGLESDFNSSAVSGGEIPFTAHFDLITFKSVLGAICSNNHTEKLGPAVQNMYNALKPGGVLVFAENLYASAFHHFMRKRFVKWGNNWNYLKMNDILTSLVDFSEVKYTTIGFFACFGRNERQKRLLARLDRFLEPVIPAKRRYILSVVAIK